MSTLSETTFPSVLDRRLRSDPGRPLVTFYDHATGERVELSATTWANWVAKAASLLVDELGLERGDRVGLDLPTHWLGTVFLGAAWSAGLVAVPLVAPEEAADPGAGTAAADGLAAVVCGPATLPAWAERTGDLEVLACALLPLGVRFAEPVPDGVHDVGAVIWSQPDAFVALDPPTGDDVALELAGRTVSQAELCREAAAGTLVGGGRLLSVANPLLEPATLSEPLTQGGSLVLVARAEQGRLEATYVAEHATARFPA
ncbi:TIGR03089 family protein [Nocardioides sp. zg-536]|uniref:TIGR03089 family protein n=1 Tax=Nocardioides faecalis TaxID=2803858 RepID=A0A938Y4Z9_9ACTN|nr:TIGR03089 family protein [Nocardioides faecalis]MBM9459329.1 TIGR03089 family protein [Nocardioides faecalis]QVI59553.1 TIGR03089 family protein [Nocardioides faecalis]